MRRALPLVAVLLLLAGLPPTAAQAEVVAPNLTVFIPDPGRPMQPGANETVEVYFNYAPKAGSHPAPDPSERNLANKTRVVVSVLQLPAWVESARVEPAEVWIEVLPEQAAAGATYPRRVSLVLQIAPDAPALVRDDIVVAADADANGNIGAVHAESEPVKFRAAVVPKLHVAPDAGDLVVIPGGRWTDVPFTVRNDGNSEVVALLNVTLRPENSMVEFPERVTLAPGASETVHVRIRTPWTAAELGTLTLTAIPLLEDDEGPAADASVEVSGQSAVPGPSPAWLLLALLGLALRRR